MSNPIDIAKYFVFKSAFDGDLITNLKMQKLLYFVYAWTLVITGDRLFENKFEAWCNGPVLREVYTELRRFGSSPIDISFVGGLEKDEDIVELKNKVGDKYIEVVDQIYEAYANKTAFELVKLSHDSLGWKAAREGLSATDPSSTLIKDEDILSQYGKKE